MKTMLAILALVLCLRMTTTGFTEEKGYSYLWKSSGEKAVPGTYLCIADKATGFSYKEKYQKWDSANFNVSDVKYIITKSKPLLISENNQKEVWAIKHFGDESVFAYSKEDFSNKDIIIIRGGYEFFINKISLRYLKIYNQGYWDGKDNNDNTPHMEIGKCSPL